jgi:hypothetical protein
MIAAGSDAETDEINAQVVDAGECLANKTLLFHNIRCLLYRS